MPVKQSFFHFTPSPSPDVASYIIAMEEVPREPDLNSQIWNVGKPDPDSADGKIHIDLTTLDGMTSKDGVYNIGVAAVDDADNTSSFAVARDVAIDFVAPDPPTDPQVVRV